MKLKTPIVVKTHLEKPVVLTFTNIATAVCYAELLHQPVEFYTERMKTLSEFSMKVTKKPGETVQNDIVNQLTAQGIDYRTWEPPTPLLIASHSVTANPDGSIKVGCTDVTRAQLEAAYKLSTEAMQQEPVWPRWWQNVDTGTLYRADSQSDLGTYHKTDGSIIKSTGGGSMADYAPMAKLKPLTSLEAKAILDDKQ